jgi:hypothetical protein
MVTSLMTKHIRYDPNGTTAPLASHVADFYMVPWGPQYCFRGASAEAEEEKEEGPERRRGRTFYFYFYFIF